MIQFNLLPDVKLEYIKAQRNRRLVLSVSILVTAISIGLLGLLLAVNGLQKKHLSDLYNDIQSESSQLKSKPDIDKVLTVQNQLSSITTLHAGKPAASRLYGYLNQVTPAQVSINSFHMDFTTQAVTITGNADALSTVNKYVDTLKYTTYKTDTGDATKAFSDVVLSSFGLTGGQSGGMAASYSVTLTADKALFDNTQKVTLNVPKITTTRAAIEQPSDLFQAAPQPVKAKS